MITGPSVQAAPRAELRTRVSVSTMVSATLLAMPAGDLRDAVLAEADRNPALVVRQRPVCPRCGRGLAAGACPRCGSAARGGDVEPAATVSAWHALHRDARLAAPRALAGAVATVLAALDERGLLTAAARRDVLRHGVGPAQLDAVIEVLRAVGPPGVAAATPAESLLVQLGAAPLRPAERALARRLLTVHAGWLEAGELARIAAAEDCSPEVVRTLLTRLGRLLRPYPGLGDGPSRPAPRPPDLIFEVAGGRVRALVTESEGLALDVDPGYLAAAGRLASVRDGMRDARTVISRVQRRWSMLQRLGDLLGEHHAPALLAGSTAFAPLTQTKAAQRLRVHESTISRAVAHRHARLVSGQLIALRRMFGTNHDARAAVAELCSTVPRPPDRRVVELLAARGIVLSRRAVAKYRLELGLPAR
ncbi:MAG TPA: hypothetical protein VFV67_23690 [Actinophytocola sp.]|uniref:RNA polymerase factor sigma-54 n=1 Tax=Actinophytocola sp. TaxID=1872138 RepID=UPI002DBB0DF9|nr:hypothetical protein [Actinophytocola sp.]HEU5473661.1 hypothetical protein [Actinophytocola sp.]